MKFFLSSALAAAFLSAVAHRFGWWNEKIPIWSNWTSFLGYTNKFNPWFPGSMISTLGLVATATEIILALLLWVGTQLERTAKLSGILLLLFAFSLAFSTGIKGFFQLFGVERGYWDICFELDKRKILETG